MELNDPLGFKLVIPLPNPIQKIDFLIWETPSLRGTLGDFSSVSESLQKIYLGDFKSLTGRSEVVWTSSVMKNNPHVGCANVPCFVSFYNPILVSPFGSPFIAFDFVGSFVLCAYVPWFTYTAYKVCIICTITMLPCCANKRFVCLCVCTIYVTIRMKP